jgi:hypothetical protein
MPVRRNGAEVMNYELEPFSMEPLFWKDFASDRRGFHRWGKRDMHRGIVIFYFEPSVPQIPGPHLTRSNLKPGLFLQIKRRLQLPGRSFIFASQPLYLESHVHIVFTLIRHGIPENAKKTDEGN